MTDTPTDAQRRAARLTGLVRSDSPAARRHLAALAHGFGLTGPAANRRPAAFYEAVYRTLDPYPDSPAEVEAWECVAGLCARFHRGSRDAHAGFGDLGGAARRLAGTNPAGAARIMDRLLSDRSGQRLVPVVTSLIDQLRQHRLAPPSWSLLGDDLTALAAGDTAVRRRWADNFYRQSPRSTATTA